jgi:hypothetical protein
MVKDRIKILFKRRRDNKIRYSANKVYTSRAELNHTNTDILITLDLYNKIESSFERSIRKAITYISFEERIIIEDGEKKKIYIPKHKNRLFYSLKNNFFLFRKFHIAFFNKINNVLRYLLVNLRKRYLIFNNIPGYRIRLLNKFFRFQKTFFTSTKDFNFSKSKFNSLNIK